MRQPLRRAPSSQNAGQAFDGVDMFQSWDRIIAAIALACMTTGFWRLWPEGVGLAEAPLGAVIIKAGLASLGFVVLAAHWEQALKATMRNPLPLILMGFAAASAIWAVNPADALRNAIVLFVIWSFGAGLVLRFRMDQVCEVAGLAGFIGLAAQLAAHRGLPPQGALGGDLAFAVIACACACLVVPARRTLWFAGLCTCGLLAYIELDINSLGAIVGLGAGLLLGRLSQTLARKGQISLVVLAWTIGAVIFGVTLFAIFGAGTFAEALLAHFARLGPSSGLGFGFGLAGSDMASATVAGLGGTGLVVVLGFIILTSLNAILAVELEEISAPNTHEIRTGLWFAAIGAIVMGPTTIDAFGSIVVLLAASSFALAGATKREKPRRQPLFRRGKDFVAPYQRDTIAPARPVGAAEPKRAVDMPTKQKVSGLRPKL